MSKRYAVIVEQPIYKRTVLHVYANSEQDAEAFALMKGDAGSTFENTDDWPVEERDMARVVGMVVDKSMWIVTERPYPPDDA